MKPEHRARICAAIKVRGASEVARRLGLSTEAVLRLAGDFGSHEGTEVLALQRLSALDDNDGAPDAA
jgi:hypothetical protein